MKTIFKNIAIYAVGPVLVACGLGFFLGSRNEKKKTATQPVGEKKAA